MTSRLAILVCLSALFFTANGALPSCTEYNQYSNTVYYYYSQIYYYSCGWYGWSTCSGYQSILGFYYTYYSQLDCCVGYGNGAVCTPVCNSLCGTNMECSLPNVCTCVEGWTASNCLTDIDECATQTDLCEYSSTCSNTAGAYDCDCINTSDKLSLDGHRCISPVTNLVTISDSREIKLTWTHPFNLTDDGTFDSYDISCTAVDNTTVIASTLDAAGWVEEFVVGPLTPFRYYTCTVKAVTVGNGNSFPVMVTVATLEDEPDDPPSGVIVNTIDSKILEIIWIPPQIPNGIIQYHRLYIDYTNTTRIYEIEVDPAYNIFFLEFLYPHQTVGISVSATTGGGEGPSSAFVYNTTAEAEPGRVSDIQVEILSDTSAQLIWTPPATLNGIITSYHIYLYKVENGGMRTQMEDWVRDHDDELSVKVFYLLPYVPYEFVIVGATTAGYGEIAPFKFFTKENVPNTSPTISTSNRASAEEIYITWNRLTDDVLQGFFVDYVVKFYTTAVHTDCSSPMDEMTVTTTNEYMLLKELDPHTAYCVKVAAASSQGTGQYSSYVFVDEFDNDKFELHLHGVHDCPTYVHDDESSSRKFDDITGQITDVLNNQCQCNVQDSYIGELRFICADDEDNDRIILQGSIVGTALASSQKLIQDLDDWRATSPHFVVLGVKLYVNNTCPVALESYDTHTQCAVPKADAQLSVEGDTVNIAPYVGGFVGAGIAIIAVIIVALVVVIVIVVIRRSGNKKISGQDVKFVNSTENGSRVGVSNPIGGTNDYDEKELLDNMN